MPRFFDGSTSYFQASAVPLTVTPLTMSIWYNPQSVTGAGALMAINDSTSNVNTFEIISRPTGAMRCNVALNNSFGVATTANNVVIANAWNHCAAVFTNATSRDIYCNMQTANNTTSITPTAINVLNLGCRYTGGTRGTFVNACALAYAGIWNVALTVSEILQLSQGVLPLFVRPQNLIAYYPLDGAGSGTEYNRCPWQTGKYDLATNNNALVSSPGPLIWTPPRRLFFAPSSNSSTITISDSGIGADVLGSIAASGLAGDSGSGADTLNAAAASMQLADACGGLDQLASLISSFSVSDASSGADSLIIAATLQAIIDSCVGADAVANVTFLVQVADTGFGVDQAPQATITLAVTEGCSGADLLAAIAVALSAIDAAGGSDAVVAFATGGRVVTITFTALQRSITFAKS